jgi:TolB protein
MSVQVEPSFADALNASGGQVHEVMKIASSHRVFKQLLGLLYLGLCLSVLATLSGCSQKFYGQSPSSHAQYSLRLLASDPVGGSDGAISPDGRYFVISSKRSGTWNLWAYDLEHKQWSRITTGPGDDSEAQWSPDGKRLTYTSTKAGNKDIYVTSLEDHSIKQLTDDPEEDEYPAWSPDGQTIVYTGGPWQQRDFFLIPADGGPARKLTRKSGQAGACSFDPGGESVICHRYDSGRGNVERIPLNGDPPVPVTTSKAWDYKPTISPDGKWLAFSRTIEGPAAIWLMPASGGAARPLTLTSGDDRWPTWSKTGQRLFFHRDVNNGTSIKILNRRTGRERTVVGPDEKPGQASFDPQARRIVYGAETNGRLVLRIMDLATGAVRQLDTGVGEASFPRWSPDGNKIAFMSKNDERWELCTINVDGTGMVDLTQSFQNLKGMNAPVDWSPDGTKIVFKGDTDPFEAAIYVVDVKGGKVRNVTNDKWFNESPSWTPDGKSVTFMSTRGGNWTWGLFSLSLNDGAVSVVAPPDYTEKNFPRMGSAGWTVWSMYGEDGTQYLAEKSPAGKVQSLKEAGARWPSYSTDNHWLLFTTVEHRIEYWLAENLYDEGSPLLLTDVKVESEQPVACRASDHVRDANALGLSISPVKLSGR